MQPVPANPPRRSSFTASPPFFRRQADVLETQVEGPAAPLPANWDQLDPDQRVRTVGEW